MDNIESVVICAQQGDEKAFQQLYDQFYKKCYYTALKISNYCEADAQDVVQDTFFEIHRSIANLRDPKFFRTWMTRILISKCSHKFRDNHDMYVDPETLLKMERHTEKRMYMVPGKQLSDDSDKAIIMHLVDELKPKQKEVLILQYFHNLSLQEIADVLDVPLGTVKTRSMYARNELAQKVKSFEKKENRRLGFQVEGIGIFLAAAFAHDFMSCANLPLLTLRFSKGKKLSLGTQATNVLLAGGIALAGVTACVSGYQFYENLQKNQALDHEVNRSVMETKKEPFQTVHYQDISISSCRDAYYTLKEWAPNAEKLQQQTSEEKEKIRPVYEELKRYQGVYWEKLVNEKWVQAFDV